ncbi:MAG: exodeoxyribonuclease V subunit gamma [Burkholderiaceae bacterium]
MPQDRDLGPDRGLVMIHSNQAEVLRDFLVSWIRRHPLSGLAEETILVQSNGVAQWLKLALAADPAPDGQGGLGIAACLDLSLPSRFVWQAYRAVLGPESVPDVSPFDKDRLVWRLMRLLTALPSHPDYAPLSRFLGDSDDASRRYQLADQIADLFDQYQVYRADWLNAWALGEDVLIHGYEGRRALPPTQRWQAALWRALLEDVGPQAQASRAAVHSAFLKAIAHARQRPIGLPSRVFVFGVSSLPRQSLEVLRALGQVSQVFLCVINPSAHDWSEAAHPLLATWGKQGRDYLGLLHALEHAVPEASYVQPLQRIDLFQSAGTGTLLAQLQDDIRLSRSLAEARDLGRSCSPVQDRSLTFHRCHSPQREVEVLHDQLLAAFDADPSLQPRDVVVMVPDINAYAPTIEAVFGLPAQDDPRAIPFSMTDRSLRQQLPIAAALDFLLGITESRVTATAVSDLLGVPAIRQRIGLKEEQLPLLIRWIHQANIRWGLDGTHRAAFGGHAVTQNTWVFGLHRMLLGYAMGDSDAYAPSRLWRGVTPFSEVSGLDAACVGSLSMLVSALTRCLREFSESAAPRAWSHRLDWLLRSFFLAESPEDKAFVAQAQAALATWQEACDQAVFDGPLPLSVVRTHWAEQIEKQQFGQRFFAGRVTFATLMPMRAVPFRMVCLLGLNDGDFPRSRPRPDFDLMGLDLRPGDRSRRDDDRYLFLEALLSARDRLHLSWVGQSAIDNTERPCSVLVSQLRDYLDAVWSLPGTGANGEGGADTEGGAAGAGVPLESVSQALTVVHRLQPFHPAYFASPEGGSCPSVLFSYATDWQAPAAPSAPPGEGKAVARLPAAEIPTLDSAALGRFLRDPVASFFKDRLRVFFDTEESPDDEEPFRVAGLSDYRLLDTVIAARLWARSCGTPDSEAVDAALDHLRQSGDLPVGGLGAAWVATAHTRLDDLFGRWEIALQAGGPPAEDLEASLAIPCPDCPQGLVRIETQIGGLYGAQGEWRRLVLTSRSVMKEKKPRPESLLQVWVEHLLLQAQGLEATTQVVGQGGDITLSPIDAPQAQQTLRALVEAYREGQSRPLPVAVRTALDWLQTAASDAASPGSAAPTASQRRRLQQIYEGSAFGNTPNPGEVGYSPYLARAYPSLEALLADGAFFVWSEALYAPLLACLGNTVGEGPGSGSGQGKRRTPRQRSHV